mmetsp:Transcript_30146/g.76197  ORF Transcript_30146/g.76197 Transcript_30146/m.76197 type:complete len:283 (+) Transcript_30146:261-1109(+)
MSSRFLTKAHLEGGEAALPLEYGSLVPLEVLAHVLIALLKSLVIGPATFSHGSNVRIQLGLAGIEADLSSRDIRWHHVRLSDPQPLVVGPHLSRSVGTVVILLGVQHRTPVTNQVGCPRSTRNEPGGGHRGRSLVLLLPRMGGCRLRERRRRAEPLRPRRPFPCRAGTRAGLLLLHAEFPGLRELPCRHEPRADQGREVASHLEALQPLSPKEEALFHELIDLLVSDLAALEVHVEVSLITRSLTHCILRFFHVTIRLDSHIVCPSWNTKTTPAGKFTSHPR